MLSDESSSDSDSGIRFKTQSTRAERQTDAASSSRFPGRGGGRERVNRSFDERRFGDRRDRFNEHSNRFQDRRSPIHDRDRGRRGSPPRRRMSPHKRTSPPRERNHAQNREPERRRSPPRDKCRRISPVNDRARKLSREKPLNPPKRERSTEYNRSEKSKDVEQHGNLRDRREVRRPDEKPERRRDFREEIRRNVIPVEEPGRNSEKHIIKSLDERRQQSPKQRSKRSEDFQIPPQHTQRESDKGNPRSPSSRHSNSKRSISHEVEGNKRKRSPHDRNPTKPKRPSPDTVPPRSVNKTEHRERTSRSREPNVEGVVQKILSDIDKQPTSYYNIIPEKLKESTEKIVVEESSEDEATLRAKLLHLEKELKKTKKGKSKKKEKKHKKSKDKRKSKDRESSQVTSTTDIVHQIETEPVSKHHEGPALPPHLKPKIHDLTEDISSTQPRKSINESNEEGEIVTDSEDPPNDIDATDLRHRLKKSVVPDSSRTVSPDLKVKLKTHGSGESGSQEEGPALPPNLAKKNIGPSIPTKMREVLAERPIQKYESSSEDDGIGPLPQGDKSKWTKAHESLEERALRIKIDSLDGRHGRDDVKAREKWMLELPDAKAKIIGLGPRQFRAKEAPDMSDRTSWTDTPEERARKASGTHVPQTSSADIQREAELRHQEEKDRDHELAIKKHKKKHKRDESLLDLHQKKLKKKKKKEDKEKEESGEKVRRPFSRDTDLQVNKFDEAQKKSIIRKAQHLDTRFSRGEAKYL